MFDTFINKSSPVHTSVDITEHRAPTDESVRLLKEMEEAARNKIVESIKLEDNIISGAIFGQPDHLSWQNKYTCVFKVNGEKLTATVGVDVDADRKTALLAIRDSIAREIANKIVLDNLKTISHNGNLPNK